MNFGIDVNPFGGIMVGTTRREPDLRRVFHCASDTVVAARAVGTGGKVDYVYTAELPDEALDRPLPNAEGK